MDFDTVIDNARIIDGTGSSWFHGSLGIRDGCVEKIMRDRSRELSAENVIDINRCIVCPGFIDLHSHSDLEVFANPILAPKISQGITTEVIGQDGFSMAPMYSKETAEWKSHLKGLTGEVDQEWTWKSISDYLEAIEINGLGPNLATLVGHGTVRYNVLGMDERQPSDKELEEMANLVTEGLEQGAVGLSTGLVYPPQYNADTNEVLKLASQLEPFGRPLVAHIRSEGRWVWEALNEFVNIGNEADIPIHLSHYKLTGEKQFGKSTRTNHVIENARERGIDFTADQYPFTSGSTFLSALLPPRFHSEGTKKLLARIKDQEVRECIKRDIEEWRVNGWSNPAGKAGWENVTISSVQNDDNKYLEGETVGEISRMEGKDPVDVICDLLIEEELSVNAVLKVMDEDDVQNIMQNERVAIGTDGLFGGKPHPRTYGTYPRILGHYVRKENLFTIEEAIRKMTALPASIIGLDSKGLIRPGMDADLVVFDPETINNEATYNQPKQHPKGIHHVLINGDFVIRNGELTGKAPGSIITPRS